MPELKQRLCEYLVAKIPELKQHEGDLHLPELKQRLRAYFVAKIPQLKQHGEVGTTSVCDTGKRETGSDDSWMYDIMEKLQSQDRLDVTVDTAWVRYKADASFLAAMRKLLAGFLQDHWTRWLAWLEKGDYTCEMPQVKLDDVAGFAFAASKVCRQCLEAPDCILCHRDRLPEKACCLTHGIPKWQPWKHPDGLQTHLEALDKDMLELVVSPGRPQSRTCEEVVEECFKSGDIKTGEWLSRTLKLSFRLAGRFFQYQTRSETEQSINKELGDMNEGSRQAMLHHLFGFCGLRRVLSSLAPAHPSTRRLGLGMSIGTNLQAGRARDGAGRQGRGQALEESSASTACNSALDLACLLNGSETAASDEDWRRQDDHMCSDRSSTRQASTGCCRARNNIQLRSGKGGCQSDEGVCLHKLHSMHSPGQLHGGCFSCQQTGVLDNCTSCSRCR